MAEPSTASHDTPEVIITDQHRVMCDGGGGALGHPRVWYTMGEDGSVDCLYCDRRFVARGGPHDPGRPGAQG